MSAITLFYVPTASSESAQNLGEVLLNQGLVGCVNIVPVTSMYHLGDEIARDGEFILVAKTTNELALQVEQVLEEVHPYDTPCILFFQVKVNASYYAWLCDQVVNP